MQTPSAYISLQLAFRFRFRSSFSAPSDRVSVSRQLVCRFLFGPRFAIPSTSLSRARHTLANCHGSLQWTLGPSSSYASWAAWATWQEACCGSVGIAVPARKLQCQKKPGSSPHGDDPGQMKRWQNRLMMALKRLGSAVAIAGGQARIEPGPLLRRSGAVQERSRSTPGAAVLQHSWSRPECSARFQRSKPALLPIPPSPSCAGRRPVARWLPRLFFLPGRHGRNCSIPTRCSGPPARCPAPPASA